MRTGAIFIDGILGRLVDARVADQAQVAVGGIHAHFATIDEHAGAAVQLAHRLVVKIQASFLAFIHALVHGADSLHDGIVRSRKIHKLLLGPG